MSMKSMSWGLDRKPSPATLLEYYDQLDRQVREIKNQFRRGVLGPQHVQAFVEHRAEIFPDAFWSLTSRGASPEELMDNSLNKGWTGKNDISRESAPSFQPTAGVTYHLVGITGDKLSKRSQIEWPEIFSAGVRRRYEGVPHEALALLTEQYTLQELGYAMVFVIHEPPNLLDPFENVGGIAITVLANWYNGNHGNYVSDRWSVCTPSLVDLYVFLMPVPT